METPGFPLKQPQQDPDAYTKSELQAAGGGIKPKVKVEPGEAQEHSPTLPPPAFDDDGWEITPLTGEHPYFTTVMSRSQVQTHFQLVRTDATHTHTHDSGSSLN